MSAQVKNAGGGGGGAPEGGYLIEYIGDFTQGQIPVSLFDTTKYSDFYADFGTSTTIVDSALSKIYPIPQSTSSGYSNYTAYYEVTKNGDTVQSSSVKMMGYMRHVMNPDYIKLDKTMSGKLYGVVK